MSCMRHGWSTACSRSSRTCAGSSTGPTARHPSPADERTFVRSTSVGPTRERVPGKDAPSWKERVDERQTPGRSGRADHRRRRWDRPSVRLLARTRRRGRGDHGAYRSHTARRETRNPHVRRRRRDRGGRHRRRTRRDPSTSRVPAGGRAHGPARDRGERRRRRHDEAAPHVRAAGRDGRLAAQHPLGVPPDPQCHSVDGGLLVAAPSCASRPTQR